MKKSKAKKGFVGGLVDALRGEQAAIKRVKKAKASNGEIDREARELAKKLAVTEGDARTYLLHERKKKQRKEKAVSTSKQVGKELIKFGKKLDEASAEYVRRQKNLQTQIKRERGERK